LQNDVCFDQFAKFAKAIFKKQRNRIIENTSRNAKFEFYT